MAKTLEQMKIKVGIDTNNSFVSTQVKRLLPSDGIEKIEESHMESREKMSKQVKFASDVKEEDATFTPFRKPHDSAIRKKWFECLQAREYEQLRQNVASYEQKGVLVRDFFSRQGRVILDWAITNASSSEPLKFICEIVPREIIKRVIAQEENYVLQRFLLAESGMDEYKKTNQTRVENRNNKIKLLLEVDPEGVQSFMKENVFNESGSEGVKASFSNALQQNNRMLKNF